MSAYPKGTRIQSLVADADLDENDNERDIPVGSIGTIHDVHEDDGDDTLHVIFWANGGVTSWMTSELRTQAKVLAYPVAGQRSLDLEGS